MELPLDASKPYREKYLDETPVFADWFPFGSSGAGTDINDGTQDVIINLQPDALDRILEARAVFCAVLRKELCLK